MLIQLANKGTRFNVVDALSDQGISRTEARRRLKAGAVKLHDNGQFLRIEDEELFCELPVVIQFGKRDWVKVDK